MKLLCTIWAILVLTLSVQPACATIVPGAVSYCCDDYGMDSTHHDDDDDPCRSGCNPFQVCGCCAFAVIVPDVVNVSIPPAPAEHTIYIVLPSADIPDGLVPGFWQPPRSFSA